MVTHISARYFFCVRVNMNLKFQYTFLDDNVRGSKFCFLSPHSSTQLHTPISNIFHEYGIHTFQFVWQSSAFPRTMPVHTLMGDYHFLYEAYFLISRKNIFLLWFLKNIILYFSPILNWVHYISLCRHINFL